MSDFAIEIQGLRFGYGRSRSEVLHAVDLQVPRGSIFGFLGRNGAGKSTTIKLLLGLFRPRSGRCLVDGLDPQRNEIEVRRRVGYMAEDQQMYGWMTVAEIIKWVSRFYKSWDDAFIAELTQRLELPLKTKVKNLSKGQNSRLALLLALGHHPPVVILDDPTLGLDPIGRKEFLRYVIDLLQSQGVTVFFSSHLLYEIEPVADHLAILDKGIIVAAGKTEDFREKVRRFIFEPRPGGDLARLPAILDAVRHGPQLHLTLAKCDQNTRPVVAALARDGLRESGLNLDEIFEAYVIGNRAQGVQL